MIRELVTAGIWAKTRALILDKYGKTIDFKFMSARSPLAHDGAYYSQNDDLVVPLEYKNSFLGEILVHRGSTLSSQAKSEITDLIRFLIEPKAYSLFLQDVEASLIKSSVAHTDDSPSTEKANVVSLFPQLGDSSSGNDSLKGSKVLSQVVHLRAKTGLSRRKVALRIHELAKNMSFVNFADISSALHSTADLGSLGSASIFIENILEINLHEINLLGEFARQPIQGILFLVGSDLKDSEIQSLPGGENLKKDLQAMSFDIDRIPIAQQTSAEILELLFFDLGSTIS
jgi:hypothetical protein